MLAFTESKDNRAKSSPDAGVAAGVAAGVGTGVRAGVGDGVGAVGPGVGPGGFTEDGDGKRERASVGEGSVVHSELSV